MAGPLRGTGEAGGVGIGGLRAGPALGLIEVRSIARGIMLSDAVVKRAAVHLCLSRPVSPGKHLTLISGGVGEVVEAHAAGLALAGTALCDQLLLPQVHEQVVGAVSGTGALAVTRAALEVAGADEAALGIIETFSAAAALGSADVACKAAAVRLHTLRLCDGLGGKGYFVLCGELSDVEAALQAVEARCAPSLVLERELIARPHADLLRALSEG